MPYSYKNCLEEIIHYIHKNVELTDDILDIGAGCGDWGVILKNNGYKNIDALEVWLPYISEFGLIDKYRSIIVADIRNFKVKCHYKFMLMGDVLEHLTYEDARTVIDTLKTQCEHLMIVVPYLLPQVVTEGNIQETHLQADLTHDIFIQRYPEFICIDDKTHLGIQQGVWIWNKI